MCINRLLYSLLCFGLGMSLIFLPHLGNAQELRAFHYQQPKLAANSFYLNSLTPDKKRKKWVTGTIGGGLVIAGTYLGSSWYSAQDLGKFHFFDDLGEWKQIDKGGHMMGAYNASRWIIDLYKWSGVPKKKALITGGVGGFLAMSSIEVFDGFGESWGFSWSDIGANFVGASLAVGNQWLWNENRVQLKVGWRKSAYAEVDSLQHLFGSNPVEWLLKDYNGNTIWLSFRVHSFLPEGKFKELYPRWLNLAVGYGAEGLVGGYGRIPAEIIKQNEYRQYYLAFDIDLANIKTKSGFLHALFSTVNILRVPLPAIQFDRNGVKLRSYE